MTPALRKAAVLIASLDEESAESLLAQMPRERADEVRLAAFELGDVPNDEREEVLRDFLGVEVRRAEEDYEGVELAGSLGKASRNAVAESSEPVAAVAHVPFAFLHETSADSLAPLLARENPQTMAVVVAHLPAGQAAEVVARLMPRLQTEVLRRVADLGEMHPEILRDIERHIEQIVRGQQQTVQRKTAGLATVSAILSAAPGTERKQMLRNLTSFATDLAGQLGAEPTARTASVRTRKGEKTAHQAEAAPKKKAEPFGGHVANEAAKRTERAPVVRRAAPPEFTDVIALDNASLGEILRAADSQTALVALAGAPRPFVERILKQLATADAQTLERQIERLGPLRLRDIETAQRALADLAADLAAAGRVKLPQSNSRMTFVA